MSELRSISPDVLLESPFTLIGKEWLLITAEHEGRVNTMTASWGGLGILWNKPVAFIFVRPQRFTKTLIDNEDRLSLCVLEEGHRKLLSYFGTASGRDEDKIKKAGLPVAHTKDAVPYFTDSRIVMQCRKLYTQNMEQECFIDKDCDTKNYANKDYHQMYVLEIEELLRRD